jgi:hypothetical protein
VAQGAGPEFKPQYYKRKKKKKHNSTNCLFGIYYVYVLNYRKIQV